MTRNEMIALLTDNMVDSLRSDYNYCASIVRSGFVGFYEYTDEELKDAYSQIFDENIDIEIDDISHINE
jgi:hypothetical protein